MRFLIPLYYFLFLHYFPANAQIDSALLVAIGNDNIPAVQQRLNDKAAMNGADNNGANALTWAVYYCNLPMVKYLVQHGARVADSLVIYINEDINYYTSLQGMAACKGKLELLEYLADSLQLPLDEKAFDHHSRKKEGCTPLSFAAEYGHLNIVKYLLQKGVQPDVVDDSETSTPLIKAAEREHWEIFEILMGTGANLKRFAKQVDYFMAAVAKLKTQYPTRTAKELKVRQFTLELRKTCFGESSPGYAAGLNILAVAYDNMGEYEKAEYFYQKAIVLLQRISAEAHPLYIRSLNGLAFTYYNTAQYEKALPLLEQAQAIITKIYGKENPGANNSRLQDIGSICFRSSAAWPCAYNLTLQGLMYERMGKYDKAFRLYSEALASAKKLGGKGHPYNAFILTNFAVLYTDMGMYKEAIPFYQEGLVIKKGLRGDNGDSYGGNLMDMAHAYCQLGQYPEALPLFEEALRIFKKSFGEKHQYYAMALIGIAFIYERIGEYNKALSFYKQVLTIYKKALGENHPYVAACLNDLAILYMGRGEYNKALPLYQQALTIRKKVLKEGHPDYAQSLTNLAVVYERKKQHGKALYLYRKALAITKISVGEEHHYYANCLANMAPFYMRMGRFDTALQLYQQVLKIRTKSLGEAYPENVPVLNSLGLLHGILGNDPDGYSLFSNACKFQLKHLYGTYATLSEQQKITFLSRGAPQFNYLPSLLYLKGIQPSQLLHQLYQNEIALKGMALEDQQQVLSSIRKSGDSRALTLYDKWRFNKAFVGKQFLLPKTQRILYLDSLEHATTQQEQELSRRSATFKNQQSVQAITPNDIARKLTKGQASIEFIKFQLYKNKWTDSIIYAAMVLLPGDSIPKFEILFEENQLKKLLVAGGGPATTYTAIQKLYGGVKSPGNKSRPLNDALYKLIWKPLEKYLNGASSIFYAPAGLLHRVSFQALRFDTAHYLLEKYQLNQLLSTRSLAYSQSTNSGYGTVNLWGNINYNLTNKTVTKNQGTFSTDVVTNSSAFNSSSLATQSIILKGANILPSTSQEIDSIQMLLKQMQVPVTVTVGSYATEEAFKDFNGNSPKVLHLATHGFFLPAPQQKATDDFHFENSFTVQQNPMFRSGLMLAGGNNAWHGATGPLATEDGILTAYELAQLDLSNTRLMVLSACETALGDLQGNEGVIGLQRAIKLAGVKQMIVSLWKVPDKETVELMVMFYKNWLGGQSTREALRNAQLKMKEKYPPFFWAAFVVVE